MDLIYPDPEKIVEYNKVLLNEIKIKKADQHKVLSYLKLQEAISLCKNLEGNIYEKAARLLKELIQKHPFASGNRRTALFTTLKFLRNNDSFTKIKDDPKYAKILTGIREGFYTDKEITNWLKNGKIKEFKR